MISVGSTIPNVPVKIVTSKGIQDIQTSDFFKNKQVIIVAVPGAFTPTCSSVHLPGYIKNADSLKKKLKVDEIVCLSVNDVFVMKAWAELLETHGKIIMMADGNGELTREMGMELDATGFGMGMRSQRYSMLVSQGEIDKINKEASAGVCSVSSADSLLADD